MKGPFLEYPPFSIFDKLKRHTLSKEGADLVLCHTLPKNPFQSLVRNLQRGGMCLFTFWTSWVGPPNRSQKSLFPIHMFKSPTHRKTFTDICVQTHSGLSSSLGILRSLCSFLKFRKLLTPHFRVRRRVQGRAAAAACRHSLASTAAAASRARDRFADAQTLCF